MATNPRPRLLVRFSLLFTTPLFTPVLSPLFRRSTGSRRKNKQTSVDIYNLFYIVFGRTTEQFHYMCYYKELFLRLGRVNSIGNTYQKLNIVKPSCSGFFFPSTRINSVRLRTREVCILDVNLIYTAAEWKNYTYMCISRRVCCDYCRVDIRGILICM